MFEEGWYAAHLVAQARFSDGEQGPQFMQEDVVLVHASSREEVLAKAAGLAKAQYPDDGPPFILDDRSAFWQYRGVRKIVAIGNLDHPRGAPPEDGTEITYLRYWAKDEQAVTDLFARRYIDVEFDGQEG
jgi:hypothetical protein